GLSRRLQRAENLQRRGHRFRQPLTDIVTDPVNLTDPQRRILAETVDGVRVINLYVVNGKAVGDEKYEYKLDWLKRARDFVAEELTRHDKLVVIGDFNIAPDDREFHDELVRKLD